MIELIVTFVVFIAGALLLASIQQRFDSTERKFIWAAFFAHAFAAMAQVWITKYFYGGGDLLNYYHSGVRLADWVAMEPAPHLVELLKLILQREPYIPFRLPIGQGATGTMFGLAGLLAMLLGKSLYGICLLLSTAAFFGQLAIYVAFRRIFAPRFKKRLLVGALLVPSVVYWSSGLLKETVAMAGLGFLFLGIQGLVSGRYHTRHILIAAVGFVPLSLTKPYILFPFFIAAGAWYYWQRSLKTKGSVSVISKPLYLILGLSVAIGAVLLFGELFPRYSIQEISNELAATQMHQQRVTGGSSYELGAPAAGPLGQLALLPLALVSVLLRPFIFEVHNAMALINSAETTVVLISLVWIISKRGIKETYRMITSSPAAIFCLVFVLIFGSIVGLAAPNLGTLSRYRVPMMPFYVTLVLILVPMGRSSRS
ncbi:MAG: hypothetical protein ACLFVJ_11970 [Persicimonas sp.]